MAGKRTNRSYKPMGKVVGGVYVTNVRKRPERGARPRKRPTRDMVAMFDNITRPVSHLVFPARDYPRGDPRNRSRFLGRVIDGGLGWVTDSIHGIPVLGPVASLPLRFGCRIVRAGEDVLNSLTGSFGVTLFLLCLLTAAIPAQAYSNCCRQNQVHYCTETVCVHDGGCVICAGNDSHVSCWEPGGVVVSVRPNSTGVDPFLTDHLDLVAGAIYGCDLLGIGEACGLAAAAGSVYYEGFPVALQLNERANCSLLAPPGDPALKGFMTWLRQEFSLVTSVLDFARKIPQATVLALSAGHTFTLLTIVGYLIEGRFTKAILLLVLYVEAAVPYMQGKTTNTYNMDAALAATTDASKILDQLRPTSKTPAEPEDWPCNCSIRACPPVTWPNMTLTYDLACYSQSAGFVTQLELIDGGTYVQLQGKGYTFCAWHNKTSNDRDVDTWGCCRAVTPPTWCGDCCSDCSYKGQKYTYERCGTGPYLSYYNCSKTDGPQPALRIRMPWDGWFWTGYHVTLKTGRSLYYNVVMNNTHKDDHLCWARLPYYPPFWSAYWTIVPKGLYSERRDLSTGLVSKDASGNYQAFYSGSAAFGTPALTLHLLTMLTISLLGGKWSLVLYAVWIQFGTLEGQAINLTNPIDRKAYFTARYLDFWERYNNKTYCPLNNTKEYPHVKQLSDCAWSLGDLAFNDTTPCSNPVARLFLVATARYTLPFAPLCAKLRRGLRYGFFGRAEALALAVGGNESETTRKSAALISIIRPQIGVPLLASNGRGGGEIPPAVLPWILILFGHVRMGVLLLALHYADAAAPTALDACVIASGYDLWWARLLAYTFALRFVRGALAISPSWLAALCSLAAIPIADAALTPAEGSVLGFVTAFIWLAPLAYLALRVRLAASYLRLRTTMLIDEWVTKEACAVGVLLLPEAAGVVCKFLLCVQIAAAAICFLSIEVLAPKSKRQLSATMRRITEAGARVANVFRPFIVWAAGERGVFWYEHMDGRMSGDWEYRDPYFPFPTEVKLVDDVAYALACGDTIKGLPVFARAGVTVRAGIGAVPRGWLRTSPFALRQRVSKSELSVLLHSVWGKDNVTEGAVFVMGTPARGWMAFVCEGRLMTVFHGARGRALAGPSGPEPPIMVDTAADLCHYKPLPGMGSLQRCGCDCPEAFLATRLGRLVPLCKVGEKWVNTAALSLREAKGSSGAPVICKCRGVKGVFRSVHTAHGAVTSVSMIPLDALSGPNLIEPHLFEAFPPVPPQEHKKIEYVVAPTGSGKSTKMPLHYYNLGYRVLLLNPSVATTLAIPKYIHKTAGFTPNTRCGEVVDNRGSRLTYSTYGMFLASKQQLDYDIVICDECHATDSTTVLGIGACLKAFEQSGVAKLLVLATATPPGAALTDHPNITTVTLSTDGDIPFHGKALKLDNYKRGRHLIFQASKKHCEELAADLLANGLNAVYYYRGEPIDKIPETGDVVVVSTDALMTGYTGNFESVTDCCLVVRPRLIVDLNPTFSVSMTTGPIDAVAKAQRRGRTGRGNPGVYYQVTGGALPGGVVDSHVLYECYDSGLAFFGMTSNEVYEALDFYQHQSGLPQLACNPEEVCNVFHAIPRPGPATIERFKGLVDSFHYLGAAQYDYARVMLSQKPSDEPLWAGLTGTCKFPLLYNIWPVDQDKCEIPDMAGRIVACYDEVYTSGWSNLVGVGFAAAAVYMAIDLFGSAVISRAWDLHGDTTASHAAPPIHDGTTVEECAGDWAGFHSLVFAAKFRLDELFSRGASLLGPTPLLDQVLTKSSALALIQYLAGLITISEAPVVGACMAFVGGLMSPLPLSATLFAAVFGAGVAARLAGQRSALLFGLATAAGASVAASSCAMAIADVLRCYSASTSSAVVVLKLLDGQMPSLSEWAMLVFAAASPGGALVGAAAAALVALATTGESTTWMNRLLSMVSRGTTCDDFFLRGSTLRQKIITGLEQCSVWALLNRAADWVSKTDDVLCSPRAVFEDILNATGRFLRTLVEFARGVVGRVAALPAVPLYACDRPYRGRWQGTGIITSRCACGQDGVWQLEDGIAKPVQTSRLCRSHWRGGVPINATTLCTARPILTSWKTLAINTGWNNYVLYENRKDGVWIVGASHHGQTIPADYPPLEAAVMVDGVQVKSLGGDGWKKAAPYEVKVGTNPYIIRQLPTKVDFTPKEIRTVRLHDPVADIRDSLSKLEAIQRGVQRSERLLARDFPGITDPNLDAGEFDITKPRRVASLDNWLDALAGKPQPPKPETAKQPTLEPAQDQPQNQNRDTGHVNLAYEVDVEAGEGTSASPWGPLETPQGSAAPSCPQDQTDGGTTQSFATAETEQSATQDNTQATVTTPPADQPKKVKPSESKRGKAAKAKIAQLMAQMHPVPVKPKRVVQRPGSSIGLVGDEECHSLTSSSWESCSETCSVSYVWEAASYAYNTLRRRVAAVRTYTHGLMLNRNKAYVTDTTTLEPRFKKTTIVRTRTPPPEMDKMKRYMLIMARQLDEREWTLSEALEHLDNNSAKSGVTGLRPHDIKKGATRVVEAIYQDLELGKIAEPWNATNIMPKSEIFSKAYKDTEKPARIIAYPHLEMRVVEKMVLGAIAPAVAKHVLGEAYGFQYTPHQRVDQLLRMWSSKKNPAGFTCDTVCFDSTVTQEDFDFECQLYQAATKNTTTKVRIKTLHDCLYSQGPMFLQGKYAGMRYCRASGVYTTSSSNTLTCYLKVKTALMVSNIKSPSVLICGDDVVVICEDAQDLEERLQTFALVMKAQGAPQGEIPRPYRSLELLTSCSSNVSVAQVGKKLYHYMTRDPAVPFARASAEGKRFNPLGTWVGYIISNYPAIWVSRILAVQFLYCLLTQESVEEVTFEWYGKTHTVPLGVIPYVIENLHGRDCWHIDNYTPYEVTRVTNCLAKSTMKPLRVWKRFGRSVYVAAMRRGGRPKFLASTLLNWVVKRRVELDPKRVKAATFNPFDPYEDPPLMKERNLGWIWWLTIGLIGLFLLL